MNNNEMKRREATVGGITTPSAGCGNEQKKCVEHGPFFNIFHAETLCEIKLSQLLRKFAGWRGGREVEFHRRILEEEMRVVASFWNLGLASVVTFLALSDFGLTFSHQVPPTLPKDRNVFVR